MLSQSRYSNMIARSCNQNLCNELRVVSCFLLQMSPWIKPFSRFSQDSHHRTPDKKGLAFGQRRSSGLFDSLQTWELDRGHLPCTEMGVILWFVWTLSFKLAVFSNNHLQKPTKNSIFEVQRSSMLVFCGTNFFNRLWSASKVSCPEATQVCTATDVPQRRSMGRSGLGLTLLLVYVLEVLMGFVFDLVGTTALHVWAIGIALIQTYLWEPLWPGII